MNPTNLIAVEKLLDSATYRIIKASKRGECLTIDDQKVLQHVLRSVKDANWEIQAIRYRAQTQNPNAQ